MSVKNNSAFHVGEQARLLNWPNHIWMAGHNNVVHILVVLLEGPLALPVVVLLDLLDKTVQLVWLSQANTIIDQRNAQAMGLAGVSDITTSFLHSTASCEEKLATAEMAIEDLKHRYYERGAMPRIVDTVKDGSTVFYEIEVGETDIISPVPSPRLGSACVFRRNNMFTKFAARLADKTNTGMAKKITAAVDALILSASSDNVLDTDVERIAILKQNLEALAVSAASVASGPATKVRHSEFSKLLRNLYQVQNAYRSIELFKNANSGTAPITTVVALLRNELVAFLADSHAPKFEGAEQLNEGLRATAEAICNAPENERVAREAAARNLVSQRKAQKKQPPPNQLSLPPGNMI